MAYSPIFFLKSKKLTGDCGDCGDCDVNEISFFLIVSFYIK